MAILTRKNIKRYQKNMKKYEKIKKIKILVNSIKKQN